MKNILPFILMISFIGNIFSQSFMDLDAYVGNGTSQAITGVGFQPDFVMIKSAGGNAYFKTSTMVGTLSKVVAATQPADNTNILSLDADGFTVGTGSNVNNLNIDYFYEAFKATPGVLEVGTYTGDGNDDRQINVAFQPDYVIIIPENAQDIVQRFGPQTDEKSYSFGTSVYTGNRIQSMNASGFEIGTAWEVNRSGRNYHFVAFKESAMVEIGTYLGDDNLGRTIPTTHDPNFVIVQGDANYHSQQLAFNWDPCGSLIFLGGSFNVDRRIDKLTTSSFVVGNHQTVNKLGRDIYYALFNDGYPVIQNFCLLPIELTLFEAKRENDIVNLNWETATEIDHDYFAIERATEDRNFIELGQVKGQGNSNTSQVYQFEDKTPIQQQTNYYRLKSVAIDGSYEYSEIKSVKFNQWLADSFKPFPNPTKGNLTISLEGVEGNVSIALVDVLGKRYLLNYNQINANAALDLSYFENGFYYLEISSDTYSGLNYRPIIIQK